MAGRDEIWLSESDDRRYALVQMVVAYIEQHPGCGGTDIVRNLGQTAWIEFKDNLPHTVIHDEGWFTKAAYMAIHGSAETPY